MNSISQSADDDTKNIFFDSIKKYDSNMFAKCLYNLNSRVLEFADDQNMNALHHICYNNLTVFFFLFIDFDFIREKNTEKGDNTPNFNRNKNKFLLNKLINAKCDEGNTPLMYAVFRGNLKIIKKLLEFQINIYDVNMNGDSLMHICIKSDQVNVLVYLKEKLRLSVNATDKKGSTPLHHACFLGSEYCINVLLSWVDDVNNKNDEGNTPLHFLVFSEKSKLVKKLISKGADCSIKNNKGMTALDLAKSRNITNIVEMLSNEDFKTANSNFLKLNTFTGNAQKFKYANMIAFFILHFICIYFGYFILCQIYDSQKFDFLYLSLYSAVMVSYLILTIKDPGYVVNESEKIRTLLDIVENEENVNDYCPYCIVKTSNERKHCHLCKRCVELHDHHCFWINNCVGQKNFLLFMSFLILIFSNLIVNIFLAVCIRNYDEVNLQYIIAAKNLNYLNYFSKSLFSINVICNIHLILCSFFLIPVGLIFVMNIKGFRNCMKKNKNENDNKRNKINSNVGENSEFKNLNDVEKPLLNKSIDV